MPVENNKPLPVETQRGGITTSKPPLSENDQAVRDAASNILLTQGTAATPPKQMGGNIQQTGEPSKVFINENGKIELRSKQDDDEQVADNLILPKVDPNLEEDSPIEEGGAKLAENKVFEEAPEDAKVEESKEEEIAKGEKSEEPPAKAEADPSPQPSASEKETPSSNLGDEEVLPGAEEEPIVSERREELSSTVSVVPSRPVQVSSLSFEKMEILEKKLEKYFKEKKSEEKREASETRAKEAVHSIEQKRELVKAEVQRFLVTSFQKNQELRKELLIKNWTQSEIEELARQTAEIFFEGHPTYYSYLLNKELTGTLD